MAADPLERAGSAGLFVARPVLAVVINLLVIVAGLAALTAVEVREMPNVDRPVISVRTTYEGAAPETVDTEVTSVLEDALTSLDGMRGISSRSSYGSSRITIDLASGTDIDTAANEAREIVARQARQLPEDIEDPTVSKSDADADPIMRLALVGDSTLEELSRLAEEEVAEALARIDGIAEVEVAGVQENEFLVRVNRPALAARGLALDDLETALRTLRNDAPLGQIESDSQSITLRGIQPEVTAERIADLRVGATARVGDVAFVQLTAQERSVSTRVNGQSAVGMNVIRQSEGNTLTISLAAREAVAEINRTLPEGVTLVISSDDGVFVQQSITEVAISIGLAILIVVAVIFLFLRSWRATLIPTLAIPVSLIGSIATIWLTGFSVNTITLLALVLATGMVVDDAIVVVENIVRHRRMGEGARAAAINGTREVFFAVISTTATLAAVFVPISFLPGQAGGIFAEFGFVLAFAVTLSSFVALTLVPMLASRFDPGRETRRSKGKARPSLLARGYFALVDRALAWPLLLLGVAVSFAIASGATYGSLGAALTPPEDRGFFMVSGRAPAGASAAYTDTQIRQVEQIVNDYRDRTGAVSAVQSISGFGGSGSGFVIVRLAPWADREETQEEVMAAINAEVSEVAGLTVMARSGNSLGIRGAGRGLQFAVTGPDYTQLVDEADRMVAAMAEMEDTFQNPQVGYDTSQPLVEVRVDTAMANELGIDPAAVSSLINAMTSGLVPVSVFVDGIETDVRVEPGGPPLDDPGDLERVSVRTESGAFVPLSVVAEFVQGSSAASLSREGGDRAVPVSANLAPGVDLGTAAERMEALATEVLDDAVGVRLLGEAASLEQSERGTLIVFAVAFLVVLLVLAAQFESLASALVIMATVPFGLCAGVLSIWLSGGTLNYYSQIGLVMMIGIMAKNGILIVEFANQLREEGRDIDTAIREAVRLRFRPVMMTMVSTVLGGLPLVFASGAGAEAREAVGWVVVGGLGFATVFTLMLTPVFYRLIAPWGAAPGSAAAEARRELVALESAKAS
jgi:hydrophobic/amphiphilic exporter-1 (mainly G- bacteria), HAE1 family